MFRARGWREEAGGTLDFVGEHAATMQGGLSVEQRPVTRGGGIENSSTRCQQGYGFGKRGWSGIRGS